MVSEALAKEYANVRYQQPYQWAMYRSEVGPTSLWQGCLGALRVLHSCSVLYRMRVAIHGLCVCAYTVG